MRPALLSRLAGSCAVLIAASVAVGSVALPDDPARVAGDQRSELTDDDGGEALFDVPALAPGQRIERCIRIKREDGLGRVRLDAVPRGPLADTVRLAVARGEGGAFDDCDDFSGPVVFRGTLADAATGLDAADWGGAGAGRATYRFVLRAPADLTADAGDARVAFRWTAVAAADTDRAGEGRDDDEGQGDDGPAPAATTVPGTDPPQTGVAPAGGFGTPGPGSSTDRKGLGDDGKERAKQKAGAPAPGTDGTPSGPSSDKAGAGLSETLRKMAAAVARAVVEGAKRAAFPMVLLIAIWLFMLFQNRLDGRDPKLALAPVHGSPHLAFSDPGADGGRRS